MQPPAVALPKVGIVLACALRQPPAVALPEVGIVLACAPRQSLKMLGHRPLRKGILGVA